MVALHDQGLLLSAPTHISKCGSGTGMTLPYPEKSGMARVKRIQMLGYVPYIPSGRYWLILVLALGYSGSVLP